MATRKTPQHDLNDELQHLANHDGNKPEALLCELSTFARWCTEELHNLLHKLHKLTSQITATQDPNAINTTEVSTLQSVQSVIMMMEGTLSMARRLLKAHEIALATARELTELTSTEKKPN